MMAIMSMPPATGALSGIGGALKLLRLKRNLTQEQVAKKMGYTGKNLRANVQKLESRGRLNTTQVERYLDALGIVGLWELAAALDEVQNRGQDRPAIVSMDQAALEIYRRLRMMSFADADAGEGEDDESKKDDERPASARSRNRGPGRPPVM
jgi:transcriptional regulator with XRE-family HTH domain